MGLFACHLNDSVAFRRNAAASAVSARLCCSVCVFAAAKSHEVTYNERMRATSTIHVDSGFLHYGRQYRWLGFQLSQTQLKAYSKCGKNKASVSSGSSGSSLHLR